MKYCLGINSSTCRCVYLLFALLLVGHVCGQISIVSLPYNPVATNFDAYNPSSAANFTGTIPAGWTGTSSIVDTYRGQGTGTSNAGGYWGYGTGAEFSLGALRSSTPGNITYTVSYVNNSGATLNAVTLSWDYEQWRYANTSGWDCTGTGALSANGTLNGKDFTGTATGTSGTVTVTPVSSFTLSGLSITNGTSFGISWLTTDPANADNGISIDNFSIAGCTNPVVSLGSNPSVCQGTTSTTIAYSTTGVPDQFSIDYNAAANSAGFIDVTNLTLPAGQIPIVVPAAAPLADYTGVLTVRNSTGGCVSTNYNIIIHVINCTAPYMTWIPLPENAVHSNCTSATECAPGMGNEICYGLQYTPNHTGVLTSYTTGFTIDCSTLGNPIVAHASCVMTTHDSIQNGCASFNSVLINASGNTGSISVTQNVPVIIHQVCLIIPPSQSLNVAEFTPINLTTSINLTGGGFVTEEPGYTTYSASWDRECVTLPLRWLGFQAVRYDELMSQLDWTTADEINNSYFEVQRSNDNGRHFVTIGTVNATSRNEAVNTYQFIDRKALMGRNFYRLKQVDTDGRYDYSPIKTVTFTTGAFVVKAWPNPATTELTISIDHADDTGKFSLVDLTGKQILNRDFDHGTSEHVLILNDLQPGMYTLIVTSGENRYVEKIVIMK